MRPTPRGEIAAQRGEGCTRGGRGRCRPRVPRRYGPDEQEGQRGDAEARAVQGRPEARADGDQGHGLGGLREGLRAGDVHRGDEGCEQHVLGRAEEPREAGREEADRVDPGDDERPRREREREQQRQAQQIAGQHRPARVPAVRQDAGERPDDEAGGNLRGGDAGDLRRRVREQARPDRERHLDHGIAELRDALAGPQGDEGAANEPPPTGGVRWRSLAALGHDSSVCRVLPCGPGIAKASLTMM